MKYRFDEMQIRSADSIHLLFLRNKYSRSKISIQNFTEKLEDRSD